MNVLAVLFVFLAVACGSEKNTPKPKPQKPGPVATSDWEALQSILEANCNGCHNGSTHALKFDSEAAFKRSKAKRLISTNSMPPDRMLLPEDKRKLLAYLR